MEKQPTIEPDVNRKDLSADELWQLVMKYLHTDGEKACAYKRRALAVEYPQGTESIRVDPEAFPLLAGRDLTPDGYQTHIYGMDYGVQVVSPDRERAAAGLAAAAKRFSLIAANGREFRNWDELDEALEGEGDFDPDNYTPNCVGDVEDHPTGLWIWQDCKDGIMPLMARTMIRVLVEELRSAGVTDAVIRPVPRDEIYGQ